MEGRLRNPAVLKCSRNKESKITAAKWRAMEICQKLLLAARHAAFPELVECSAECGCQFIGRPLAPVVQKDNRRVGTNHVMVDCYNF